MFDDAVFINGILTTGLLILLLYLDRHEKESFKSLVFVFFISIMATYVFGVVKGAVVGEQSLPMFVQAFIEAALAEELLKFGILIWVIYCLKDFNESFDLVVYAGIIALGFAFLEDVGYYLQFLQTGASAHGHPVFGHLYLDQLATIMGSRMVPGHMLFNITAVYFIARKPGESMKNPLRIFTAFAVAVFLHGMWNYLAMKESVWFLPYLFALTTAATASLVVLSNRSKYKMQLQKLHEKIGNNLFLLDSIKHIFSDQKKAGIRSVLRDIQQSLNFIRYLKGHEQDEFFLMMEKDFSSPIIDRNSEQPEGIQYKLEKIAQRLKRFEERKADWSYYSGLVLALFFTAFLSILIIVAVSAILMP